MPRPRATHKAYEHDTDGSDSLYTPPSSDEHTHTLTVGPITRQSAIDTWLEQIPLIKEPEAARKGSAFRPIAVKSKDNADKALSRPYISHNVRVPYTFRWGVETNSLQRAGQQANGWSSNGDALNADATILMKEQRSVEELMQANFMSLSVEEKTRVLLPLLPNLDLVTKEAYRSNDCADSDVHISITRKDEEFHAEQAELMAREQEALESDRVAKQHGQRYASQEPLPTIQHKHARLPLPQDFDRDDEGTHSEPGWYQNLLRDEGELPRAKGAWGCACGGGVGCSQCVCVTARGFATTSGEAENPASKSRTYNTAHHWLATHPYRTAVEHSGTLSSFIHEQSLHEADLSQHPKERPVHVVEQPTKRLQSLFDVSTTLSQSDKVGVFMEVTKGQFFVSEATDILQMCHGQLGMAGAMLDGSGIEYMRLLLEAWRNSTDTGLRVTNDMSHDDPIKNPAYSEKTGCRGCSLGCDSCCVIEHADLDNDCAVPWSCSGFDTVPKETTVEVRGLTSDQETDDPSDRRDAGARALCATAESVLNLTGDEIEPYVYLRRTQEHVPAVEEAAEDMVTDSDSQWTTEKDEVLLNLRATPGRKSWSKIDKKLGMPVDLCKMRWKTLKNKKKALESTQNVKVKKCLKKAEAALVQACIPDKGGFDSYIRHLNELIPEKELNVEVKSGGDLWGHRGEEAASCGDSGWGFGGGSQKATNASPDADDLYGSFDPPTMFSDPNNYPSPVSKPIASASKTYTVTYWATVESGDQTVHIPIDSDNISGPEKTILTGPAKKVWKWIQEKGLGDKVGLQNAFDLAKDMQDIFEDAAVKSEEEDRGSYGSRALSTCWSPPHPSCLPFPTRSQRVADTRGGWGCAC